MNCQPPVIRFQAEHANELWHFGTSQRLGAARLGDSDVADQHRGTAFLQESWRLACKPVFISATGFLAVSAAIAPPPQGRQETARFPRGADRRAA